MKNKAKKAVKIIATYEYYDEEEKVIDTKVEEFVIDDIFRAMNWMHNMTIYGGQRIDDKTYVSNIDDGYGNEIYGKITYVLKEA